MITASSLLAIRVFYAAYFAAMGLILPYFPVFLADKGMEVAVIGVMTGLLAIAKVMSPPWVGHWADGLPPRQARYFILVASLCSALAALAWLPLEQVWLLALVVLVFGVLWAAILPLTDGLSIAVSEAQLADYGRLRVWGSIGFVLASFAGGVWLADGRMHDFPWWLAGLMLVLALAAWFFPDWQEHEHTGKREQGAFSRSFLWLLAASFMMQVSHGAYYGFYSLYLVELGYPGWQIGGLWVLGVLAEIILMWGWSKPFQQAAPAMLISVCMLLAALRWLGIGLSESWYWLVLWQLLHAASFAAFHLSAITWVRKLAPKGRYAMAQGWYSASGFGLGSTVGIMGCGVIAQQAGFSMAFFVCAGIACAGSLMAWKLPRSAI